MDQIEVGDVVQSYGRGWWRVTAQQDPRNGLIVFDAVSEVSAAEGFVSGRPGDLRVVKLPE
jgi:hypothetical protein